MHLSTASLLRVVNLKVPWEEYACIVFGLRGCLLALGSGLRVFFHRVGSSQGGIGGLNAAVSLS